MNRPIVIARAHRGEPVQRVVFGLGDNCVYLANPASIEAVESGESSPIGFPDEDVFIFDSAAYTALRSEWDQQHSTAPRSWKNLKRYRS